MSKTEKELKDYLKKDIFCSIDYASKIAQKPQIVEKLGVLLVKLDYLGFWDILDELQLINISMFSS